jgi:nicotinate-nucleotide pyrophosphorylase (carboxylating)
MAANFEALLPPTWRQWLKLWLKEDIPSFDYGGFVVGDDVETARLLLKSPGVFAGKPFFEAVFAEVGCEVKWTGKVREGILCADASDANRVVVAEVTGPVRCILMGERLALNIVTRASGIATAANEVVAKVRAQGWKGQVAGTRKTTPGFRIVEKYALLVGGASTHRMDLSHMVMLKDNHIWSRGSIDASVKEARRACGFSTKIEVECRTLEDAFEACSAGADIVMLDNFAPAGLAAAAAKVKQRFPGVVVEGSGGIRSDTICSFAAPNVDVLSMGALTQGYPALDLSLKINKSGGRREA